MDSTSTPGSGSDPLEPEFEQSLKDQGFELEGREALGDKPNPDPAKEPAKPEDKEDPEADPEKDPKKPDDGKDKDSKDTAKKEKEGDEPWRHMIAKRRQEKSSKTPEGKDPAKEPDPKPDPSKPDPSKPEPSELKKPELTVAQKAFAEKYGIEPDDLHTLFPEQQVKVIEKEGLSSEDKATLDEYRSQRDNLLIEKGYNTDFDTNVLPLLREEYPKGLSDEKIAEVRKSIFEKLQDEKYSLVPLDVLYRGDSAFRGIVKAPIKGPDNGSKVPAKGTPGKVYDFETVSEEDVKNPDFPFVEYSEYMAKKERK